jgi:hypothetical protein
MESKNTTDLPGRNRDESLRSQASESQDDLESTSWIYRMKQPENQYLMKRIWRNTI